MAFDDIPPVMRSQEILNGALDAGRKAARKVTKRRIDTVHSYARKQERERFIAIMKYTATYLKALPGLFPSIDTLTEFYRELLANDVDLDAYREKLSRMQRTPRALATIRDALRGSLDAAQTKDECQAVTKRFLGRVAGAIKRLDKDLQWLENTRKTMRSYPRLKELFTVGIAGFPNVGKTTLLTRLTGSTAEINEYAFTTKSLNLGYAKHAGHKIQFLDTPGTLNRDHMNAIERQAHLALKYVADVIVYIFDLTESYALSDQYKLRETMDEYGKPVVNFLSKQDLLSAEQIASFPLETIQSQEELHAWVSEHVKKAHRA